MCAALAAPLPSSADLLLAIAGIIELPGATPVAASISETDADASKCAAAERATEAERLKVERAAKAEEEAAAAVRDRDAAAARACAALDRAAAKERAARVVMRRRPLWR